MISTSLTQRPAPPLPDPSVGRGRRLLWPALSAVGATGFVLVAHLVDPNQPGNYPTCPWLALTGTFCPGCGTLRATHALSEGHLLEALQRNPLTVAAFTLMVLGFLAGPLIFANLYYVHDYYFYASGVFLLGALCLAWNQILDLLRTSELQMY